MTDVPLDPPAGPPAAPHEVTFSTAADVEKATLERLYETVLVPAFPPAELVDLDTMLESLTTPVGSRSVIALRGGEPVAAALGEGDESGTFVLLSYLAVRDDLRSAGLGRALLNRALDEWRRAVNPLAVLAEIEDPRFHGPTKHGDPVARLRFYDRLGAGLLLLPYFQPRLRADVPRVEGMLLIAFGFGAAGLPSEAVVAFLEWYVTATEGARPDAGDEAYRALLDAAGSYRPGDIPLWPLDRATETAHGG